MWFRDYVVRWSRSLRTWPCASGSLQGSENLPSPLIHHSSVFISFVYFGFTWPFVFCLRENKKAFISKRRHYLLLSYNIKNISAFLRCQASRHGLSYSLDAYQSANIANLRLHGPCVQMHAGSAFPTLAWKAHPPSKNSSTIGKSKTSFNLSRKIKEGIKYSVITTSWLSLRGKRHRILSPKLNSWGVGTSWSF